ncbi:phycobilisome linker polypeptide [Gloeobacter kilaueensis]|uniref:CpcD/allophycocyanin linker domain protein n=1 Tax=Gloeobacter kilaueensis (strain ATCC BAA-2537 / CCAP 1431/1 / ULC 316 / JS1) TaxID=1183438 RepID=U5QNI3_GLOK1|nr:phycobilisome linker polypeptide [Gloeobacter kilaueensis]AGY60547.1 CpcD/allophycocyanin linker domain protein [Gloeobacter kilaueensis JS1]
MSGMANTGDTTASDYANRTVLIEVTGLQQSWLRTSNSTVKVPYSRLSQTIQQLSRLGGKVAKVTLYPSGDKPAES